MKKIGNIITKSKKNVFGDMFNVVKSFDEAIEGIPTLIIGVEEARKHINGFNILTKQYDNVWWTFAKTERRCEYEDDIISFYKYVILYGMEKIKYTYIDLINYKLNSIKKVINFLRDNTKKFIFLTRNSNFMFIYSEKYSTVFGISLELCEYLGVRKQKIFKLLKNVEYIHDTSFITSDLRKVIGGNTHYIPILHTYLN